MSTHSVGGLGRLGVDPMYIELGSPCENGYAESFHGRVANGPSTNW